MNDFDVPPADDPRERLFLAGVASTSRQLCADDPALAIRDAARLGHLLAGGVRRGFVPTKNVIESTERLLRDLLGLRTRLLRTHAMAARSEAAATGSHLSNEATDATGVIESALMIAYDSLSSRRPNP